jgi:hypothetical protein
MTMLRPAPTWTDSEQVLHAEQAISAYHQARAEGKVNIAAHHLLIAYEALLRARVALLQEIQCQKCPQPAKG